MASTATRSPMRGAVSWALTIAIGVALFAFLQTRDPPGAMRAAPTIEHRPASSGDAILGVVVVVAGLVMIYVPIRIARRFAAPADRFAVNACGVAWTWPDRRILEPWSRFEGDGVAVLTSRDGSNVIPPDAAMTDAMRRDLRASLVCLGRSVVRRRGDASTSRPCSSRRPRVSVDG